MSKLEFESDEEFANWAESAEGRELIYKQYEERKNKGALGRGVPGIQTGFAFGLAHSAAG